MLFGNDPKIITNKDYLLHADFKYTDLGTAAYLLEIEIKYSAQGISLN
jgi:hypothetical protein